jgi:ATP-dependent RNA helicase MSS116, mitochondrial
VEHERNEGGEQPKLIVFGTTAKMVALYAEFFRSFSSLKIYELHSRLSQPARTRTTNEFKEASTGIMFASDVIGRGMDFPNVTSVIQIGLPMNGEQYVHRVGRTARVDRDGRAVILLTQAESFFVATNKQLPIHPYGSPIDVFAGQETAMNIMASIEAEVKQKAYAAYLGFMKGFMNKLRVDPAGLVAMANELAIEAFGFDEPPLMEKSTVSKMGLKGVYGLRLGNRNDSTSGPKRQKTEHGGQPPRGGQTSRGRGRGGFRGGFGGGKGRGG